MHGFQHALELLGRLLASAGRPETSAVASAFLAAMFLTSGVAKLRDIDAVAVAISEFRLTPVVWPVAGAALAAGELLLVVTLLVPTLRLAGLIGATALLTTFAILIATSLANGRHFSCACFGGDTRISRGAAARAAVLALIAAGPVAGTFMTSPEHGSSSSGWLLAVMVGAGAWACIGLLAQIRRVLAMSAASNELLIGGE